MFTGIIEETGKVKSLKSHQNLSVLTIEAKKILKGLGIGQSVAVNGVCLTATHIKGGQVWFDMMKETLLKTGLQTLKTSQKVNLERPLRWGDRLGGHFVTGHVDGIGTIKKIITLKNYVEFQISLEKKLMQYLVPKGSVGIDGISLTVGKVTGQVFSVYLIPHTMKVTNLADKKTGDIVNIETDLVAKYILK